ncbi:MAG TPA: heavy metal-binding domain-containing protein [Micromonosporaceae bacterium]
MLVLTIDHVPGYRIEAILGEVMGATVRPDNPYVEGVKSLDGVDHRREAVIGTRAEAVAHMVARARQMGANAIVGMRFDHRTVAGSWSEVCAYGTALVLTPRRGVHRIPEQKPTQTRPA